MACAAFIPGPLLLLPRPEGSQGIPLPREKSVGRIKGRHRRPSKTTKVISSASTVAASGIAVAAFAATASAGTGGNPVIHATTTAVIAHTTNDAPATGPSSVTVIKGDTLTNLAQADCPTVADWTGLYLSNKNVIGDNPDVIEPGEQLTLDCYQGLVSLVTPYSHWHHVNHLLHLDRETAPAPEQVPSPQESTPVQAAAEQHPDSSVNPSDYSGFQQCVITRESGGNANVMNSSGHYGLYQFSASTWAGYGGDPSAFGHASVSEQNKVFDNAMAQGGESNWSPYDGC